MKRNSIPEGPDLCPESLAPMQEESKTSSEPAILKPSRRRREDKSASGCPSPSKNGGYTTSEDVMIMSLKAQGLTWGEMSTYFEGRSATALRLHYRILKDMDLGSMVSSGDTAVITKAYTPEQDRVLMLLKEVRKLSWKEISDMFPGKSPTALRLHYAKLKRELA